MEKIIIQNGAHTVEHHPDQQAHLASIAETVQALKECYAEFLSRSATILMQNEALVPGFVVHLRSSLEAFIEYPNPKRRGALPQQLTVQSTFYQPHAACCTCHERHAHTRRAGDESGPWIAARSGHSSRLSAHLPPREE